MSSTDLFGSNSVRRDATFADAGSCRLTLTRDWGPGRTACMIGCNPSRAGRASDDPTSLWWMRWGQALGFGRFVAVNLYPFISSSPAECRTRAAWQENGPDWLARDLMQANLDVVVREAKSADMVIACWGAIAWDLEWAEHVIEAIQFGDEPWPDLYCFGRTAGGAPTHPMARGKHRLPRDVEPKLWRAAR
ncbi:DUF1643 domain-containing protein [Mesorhizobium sp. J428]|uniref:DUF1643 domain-containing protein n=1 Tax=Mesorhizobium sp. J428 TaxID=2898440 RepID=UPI002150FF0C|nr:DUF1643 domain-containing protein [Mesorhizobium sp. J428]MCR5855983.1 DUF1643 domain-containing protein [Mesorhizobium sp. J428]